MNKNQINTITSVTATLLVVIVVYIILSLIYWDIQLYHYLSARIILVAIGLLAGGYMIRKYH